MGQDSEPNLVCWSNGWDNVDCVTRRWTFEELDKGSSVVGNWIIVVTWPRASSTSPLVLLWPNGSWKLSNFCGIIFSKSAVCAGVIIKTVIEHIPVSARSTANLGQTGCISVNVGVTGAVDIAGAGLS